MKRPNSNLSREPFRDSFKNILYNLSHRLALPSIIVLRQAIPNFYQGHRSRKRSNKQTQGQRKSIQKNPTNHPHKHTTYSTKLPQKKEKKNPNFPNETTINLGPGGRLPQLFLRDDNGPGLPGLAEHLLGLEHLTLLKDEGPDGLGSGDGGIEDLLDPVDEGDGDLRRVVVGPALDLELTGRVGLLGLPGVALGKELHAGSRARVQGVELYPHLRQELQHLVGFSFTSEGGEAVFEVVGFPAGARPGFWSIFIIYQ